MIYKKTLSINLTLVLFFFSFGGIALADKEGDCRADANIAYNAALMREEGKSEDEIIAWISKLSEKLGKLGGSEEDLKRLMVSGLGGMMMLGNPQSIGQSTYDLCMDE